MKWPFVLRKTMDDVVSEKQRQIVRANMEAETARQDYERELAEVLRPLAKKMMVERVDSHPADGDYTICLRVDGRMLEVLRRSPRDAAEFFGRDVGMRLMMQIDRKSREPYAATPYPR